MAECNKEENDSFCGYSGETGGTDMLGRELLISGGAPPVRMNRTVGIFYFLCLGRHGRSGPYNISEIVARDRAAVYDPQHPSWGGDAPYHWGEPLFGYYTSDDTWVYRRHVELLTEACIDFLVFDTTNTFIYKESYNILFPILDEYRNKGWRVPQFAFYTNTESGRTMHEIYQDIYLPGRYRELWFMWDNKPLIIGDPDECSEELKAFFRIKRNQWPFDPQKVDGFPWIEWKRPQPLYYNEKGDPEVVSVSIAQHPEGSFSASAFYGSDKNWTRSFRNGKNDYSKGAVNFGYNIAEQWERARDLDPPIVFVTGWNEWVAGRFLTDDPQRPIMFVDLCDQNNSRDIEPMRGGHWDSYYMQLINDVRKYKGYPSEEVDCQQKTIQLAGGFDQWNSVASLYKGFAGSTVPRHEKGFGDLLYVDTTGRNDLCIMKICHDLENLYFYTETVHDITPPDNEAWMNLFISIAGSDEPDWEGYHYAVNRKPPNERGAVLEKCLGGWNWKYVSSLDYRLEKNYLHFKIPRKLVNMDHGSFELHFKWADHAVINGDIYDFYSKGDTAPVGRLHFIYRATDE
jgi:hypothetical protein